MIFKMTMRTVLFAILFLAATGCKKTDPDKSGTITTPEQPALTAGIYAVGTSATSVNALYKATIWKNGVLSQLTDKESHAYAIAIKDRDIYVAGSVSSDKTTVACYWKNGQLVQLSNGPEHAEATAITIVGNDVLVAGYISVSTITRIAAFWKNGVFTAMTPLGTKAMANGIAVLGSDVYISGFYDYNTGVPVACYWKNGTLTPLTNSTLGSCVYGVTVSGNDVYFPGFASRMPTLYTKENIAALWKNGNMEYLTKLDNTVHSLANAVAISGGNYYVSGASNNGSDYQAVSWSSNKTSPISAWSYGNAIALQGNEVYTAGSRTDPSNKPAIQGAIWKNDQIFFAAKAPSEITGIAIVQ